MAGQAKRSIEERLLAVEDRLEILNLVGGHPPGADSASGEYAVSYWLEDGVFDRGDLRGSQGHAAMIANLQAPGFQGAIRQGITHFTGLPYIEIDGDTAVVTSYLQILAPDPDGKPFELSAHGTSTGFRVHRLTANRWELVRTQEGWKIKRRSLRSMDTPEAREMLREATRPRMKRGAKV